VYDMYPWGARADGPRTRPPAPREGNDPTEQDPDLDPATHAVQVALDRRDNGGEAADQTAATAARQ
jgi:hypothetical protein